MRMHTDGLHAHTPPISLLQMQESPKLSEIFNIRPWKNAKLANVQESNHPPYEKKLSLSRVFQNSVIILMELLILILKFNGKSDIKTQ